MADIIIELAGLKAELTALVAGKVDIGGGTALLRILSGAAVTLCDVNLPNPAFSASGDDQELNGVPLQGTAVATGTAAEAQVIDRAGAVVWSGAVTVVGGGGFVTLDKVEVETSDVINIQSITITPP